MLVVYAILAFIATLISITILSNLLPSWFKSRSSPLQTVLSDLLLYVFFFLFTFRMLSRASLPYNRLFGIFPRWRTLGRYSLWAIPLIILSVASTHLLFFPLSFLFPGLVKWWLIEFPLATTWASGDNYILANLLSFLSVVIIVPILEEFFFRGILLTRWSVKWNVVSAVIASSTVFALPHIDPIDAFCFGYVMAIFYIRTKSLFIPISLHVVNNLIAWIMEFLDMYFDDPTSYKTLAELQELWWIGPLALVISIPFVFQFWKRYISNINWQVPYLSESPNSEDNANSSTYE